MPGFWKVSFCRYLDKDTYVVQVWTTGFDTWISDLLRMRYRLVLSNYDAWYFDCGYGAWLYSGSGTKNNWCAPYKGKFMPTLESRCNPVVRGGVLVSRLKKSGSLLIKVLEVLYHLLYLKWQILNNYNHSWLYSLSRCFRLHKRWLSPFCTKEGKADLVYIVAPGQY